MSSRFFGSGLARRIRHIWVVALVLVLAGCGISRVTLTRRSGTEQELLVRSLERAVARLDITPFVGKHLALDLYAWTEDQAFAKEFVTAKLKARGLDVVSDAGKADLRLKIFATVLGVDNGQTLIGTPTFAVPVLNVPVPEIAIFKWVRNRGHTELEIFAYDPHTDQFIAASPLVEGHAKFDEFVVLLFIGFTVDDFHEPPEPANR